MRKRRKSEEYNLFKAQNDDIVFTPVSPYSRGQGLPYAPSDWPNKGDIWTWKVGKRVSSEGFFVDRYLYLPKRLRQRRKAHFFPSKLSIEQFVKSELNEDINKFFSSFCWNIPSKKLSDTGDSPVHSEASEETEEDPETLECEAGNKDCVSIMEEENSEAMSCDICCSEPGFCRDCCCILCSKVVDSAHYSYSFIRCRAKVSGESICGHVSHIDCALRAYLAGTVGGSIGLDVEYYCRRCDMRTQLVPHVQKSLDLCRAVDDRDDVEKILKLGARILFGSRIHCPKILHGHIESALTKLKSGASLRDMWEEFDKVMIATADDESAAAAEEDTQTEGRMVAGTGPDQQKPPENGRAEGEVEEVLRGLRKSQEEEYQVAERRLGMQRQYLAHLREQLELEKGQAKRRRRWGEGIVAERDELLRRELARFENMKGVRKGFGHVSSEILKTHFGFDR